MLSAQNDLITRTGSGTPAGRLMRCYWQPAALVDELSGNGSVASVRLLAKSRCLPRRARRYGLIDRTCSHRGTGPRVRSPEQDGLRCSFHGWLFDVTGQCLRPRPSRKAAGCEGQYPPEGLSGGGEERVLFAYMGGGEPPAFPHFDCFTAPATHHLCLSRA
jgi:phenylpropionate dioxygenase-like ring-hydroxylating dioxygenase large terminal subunit